MITFIVVGDLMLDVTARLSAPLAYASDSAAHITTQAGGSAANTARWLAATGHRTVLAGAVGADAAGAQVRAELAADGVELAVETVDMSTGTCVVIVEPGGERTMLPDRGANTRLGTHAIGSLGPAAHLHLSAYPLLAPDSHAAASAIIRAARERGVTVSVDCASAAPLEASQEAFRAAVRGVDLLLANADESQVLGGPQGLLELAPLAVVKLGPQGAACHRRGAPPVSAPAEPTEVVDATGAGDAFAAGFLPAWKSGEPDLAALSAGTALAARAVARVGAGPGRP